jgi:hypothetical protein
MAFPELALLARVVLMIILRHMASFFWRAYCHGWKSL